MPDVFISGFLSEILKLAGHDAVVDTPDPNLPWRADSEARGIKNTARLPSKIKVGQFGDSGAATKPDTQDTELQEQVLQGDI